jgi:S-adenosylmethionine decarboxylase
MTNDEQARPLPDPRARPEGAGSAALVAPEAEPVLGAGTDEGTSSPRATSRPGALGKHALADLYEVPSGALQSCAQLTCAVQAAIAAGDLHPVAPPVLHQFAGGGAGITGVVLLAESHIAFHTYPELGYAAVDAFTCGPSDPEAAVHAFARTLGARRLTLRSISRGGEDPAE